MAINYKPTKPKKEKPVKIKQEKPVKIKQEKVAKIKKEKPVKISQDKSAKIKKADTSSVKGKGSFGLGSTPKANKKKPSVAIDGLKDKKKSAKTIKAVIIVACVVLVLALLTVAVTLYVKYTNAVAADGKNIARVYVSAYPKNTAYYIGDKKPDYSGLKIGITLKNGTNHYVEYSDETASEFTFKGFDTSAYSEQQTITVTYKGYECKFDISVTERPQATPILDKISLETLPKTEYKVGEWLSTTGGVILLEYTNHPPLRVNLMNKDVYGWQEAYEAGPGTYTLTVIYVEDGVLAETTYDITITE